MWLSQTAVCCPHEAVLFKKHEGDAMAEMMVVATLVGERFVRTTSW